MHALTRRAALASFGATLAGPASAQPAVSLGEAQASAEGGGVDLLFAKPSASPAPIVLVAEAGPAFADLTRSACRLLAQNGYLAVAPSLFAKPDPADARTFEALDAVSRWAAANCGDPARLGVVGFGPGGRATWLYDAHSPAVKAAIAWYGPVQGPALDAVTRLHGPLLGLYGKDDGTPERTLLDAEAKAKQTGRKAEIVRYVGAGANFAAVGQPSYSEAAALDGWKRTLAWLKANGVG